MVAKFFVNRPIFACVIAIIIMLSGILSINSLSISQYPDIAPPSIRISASYSGASAETVENSITQIIEQQLTGLDGLLYFSSTSSSSGDADISVSFIQGTDPDTAQQQVQNKISQITSRLPTSVQQTGVQVNKSQSDFLLMASVYDEKNKDSATDISDYLVSNLQDPIARLDGVGSVQVFGSEYAMRIWLDPNKLKSYYLMPSDIQSAIENQNVQVSAGKLGALPTNSKQELNVTVTEKSMLQTAEQFEKIIIKNDINGAPVYLSDVARVELGNESYDQLTRLNGHPASGIAIMLASGANALATADLVHNYLDNIQHNLPDGYKIAYPKDTSEFVKLSINEVYHTLFEAIFLVILVMFIFLQDWRVTIIPAITVPVVLLGTFTILKLAGFSINTLTMFALVLSIGLLVDDAIVVVENVERLMRIEGLNPKQATIKSMSEITSALIGIATVLSVVFIPMAFFSGSTGIIYRQFSITIVSSMVLSALVSLTLTPALCGFLLKSHNKNKQPNRFSYWFNSRFRRLTTRYCYLLSKLLKRRVIGIAGYVLLIVIMTIFFLKIPTGFLPNEDQGDIMVQFTLPTGASINRTLEVAKQVENYFITEEKDNISSIFTISGFTFGGSGQNSGMGFVSLKNWSERVGDDNTAESIANRATQALSKIKDANVFTMIPPAISGLGQSDGFSMEIKADGGTTRKQLLDIRDDIIDEAKKHEQLSSVRFDGTDNAAQINVQIDQSKAMSLGTSLSDIDNTLTTALAGIYVNDFIDRSRVKKVYIQGDAEFRSSPENIYDWSVINSSGTMTSFSSFAEPVWTYGPESLSRYNGFASYEITGSTSKGVSSGEAMDIMEKIADKVGKGATSFEWSGLSYQEKIASGQALQLYVVSILIVFLCLAALYESWSIPFSVILVLPLGIIGTVLGATIRDLNNDVYFQVALLTTIGLSSKNAILIVEFAESNYQKGQSLFNAVIEAARLRLRPILMTSIAFIAGVMPLVISSGAGANSRISIGTGIVGGTFTATILAIFFVPLFYIIIRRLFPKRKNLL